MEAEPFERVLGRRVGAFMRQLHESHGVHFRMGAVVARFAAAKRDADALAGVVLKGVDGAAGDTLPASLVVLGGGIVPAVSYLKGAC